MAKLHTLNWNERFALINHFKLSDEQICTTFGISSDDLSAARGLLNVGTFTPSKTLDFSKYQGVFNTVPGTLSTATEKLPTATVHTRTVDDLSNKPVTASRKPKEPGRRGRKGNKIEQAFEHVPTIPVSAEKYAAEHGISVAVLRQHKRFDKNGHLGQVNVRQDKETKVLMIWRDTTAKQGE